MAPERSDSKVSLMQLEFSLSRGKKKHLFSILRGEEEERERYNRLLIGKVSNTKSIVHMNTTGIFQINEKKSQNETKAKPTPNPNKTKKDTTKTTKNPNKKPQQNIERRFIHNIL